MWRRYFRLGHRRLTFNSFVGYLQVGTLGIEILPKLSRDASGTGSHAQWQSLLLEMLRVSAGVPLRSPSNTLRGAGRPTLFELVAVRFTEELERLLHEGLAKGYRDVEANGSTFRGRQGEYFDRRHRCGSLGVGLFEGVELRPQGMVAQVGELLGRVRVGVTLDGKLA